MPNPDLKVSASSRGDDSVPAALLSMQQRAENAFMEMKAQEQIKIALQWRSPPAVSRPPRWGKITRGLMRAIPALRVRWQARALRDSGLFDAQWYLASYDDVRAAKTDPAVHYLKFGAAEGRDPGPYFATRYYLRVYPDVKHSGTNPLVHYLTWGLTEKRSIHPLIPEGQA